MAWFCPTKLYAVESGTQPQNDSGSKILQTGYTKLYFFKIYLFIYLFFYKRKRNKLPWLFSVAQFRSLLYDYVDT